MGCWYVYSYNVVHIYSGGTQPTPDNGYMVGRKGVFLFDDTVGFDSYIYTFLAFGFIVQPVFSVGYKFSREHASVDVRRRHVFSYHMGFMFIKLQKRPRLPIVGKRIMHSLTRTGEVQWC